MSTPLYKGFGSTAGVVFSCMLLPAAFGQSMPEARESSGAPETALMAPPKEAPSAPEEGLAAAPTLVRVTSSFEVNHAAAVLRQVARLFSAGFVRKDAEQVARMIDALAAEQSRTWEFTGVRKGVAYPVRVRARIDEFGMLDLDFFTSPALAPSVRGAVDGYLNARGL